MGESRGAMVKALLDKHPPESPQGPSCCAVIGRSWRPCVGHWSRALVGRRGRYLLREREARLESERLSKYSASASPLFPPDNPHGSAIFRVPVVAHDDAPDSHPVMQWE